MNNSVSFVPAFILIILSSLSIVILEQTELIKVHAQKQVVTTNEKNDCINYNSATKQILISCKSKTVTLTDISNQINNYGILDKQPQGVWLLNANLVINNGSILNIDPTDTKWLKIITDEKTPAYGIYVHGGLKIDKVKITSWNPRTNTYALSNGSRENSGPSTAICGSDCNNALKSKLTHIGIPRPFISVEENTTGTTNITNSEIAYLGYEGGYGVKSSGLHYTGGDGSIIRNNDIHHLYFGFYSASGVGHIIIENNKIHDSGHYGIDPHTETHDMVIRNNIVYDNNGTAIICSVNCHNITYENNTVYHNNGAGIVLSRNTTQSVAKNNFIHDQIKPILLDQSNNNQIYSNRITNTNTSGISLIDDSSANKIHNNFIQNTTNGISLKNDKGENTIHDNSIYSNKIISFERKGIDANSNVTSTNVIEHNNKIIK
jgi:poly(beta-D-mannuronate) C5 epimerase